MGAIPLIKCAHSCLNSGAAAALQSSARFTAVTFPLSKNVVNLEESLQ